MFLRKCTLKFNELHGVINQKMILFITTAAKTSNPTQCSSVGRLLINREDEGDMFF
jgi:hypothetical protein